MNTNRMELKKNQSHSTALSMKTQEFLKRICYKETVSADMTRNGFMKDSKLHIFQLLDKSLKNDDKIKVKKHKTSRKVVSTKQLDESSGDKHKGPKVVKRKSRLKSVDAKKPKSNFIEAPPRKEKCKNINDILKK